MFVYRPKRGLHIHRKGCPLTLDLHPMAGPYVQIRPKAALALGLRPCNCLDSRFMDAYMKALDTRNTRENAEHPQID